MRKPWRWGALLALAVAAAALVAASVGGGATDARAPILIGYAFDAKGNMAPFDGPALAAAQLQIKRINARGGVAGRMLKMEACDTANNKPDKAKACASRLLDKGAKVLFVDV